MLPWHSEKCVRSDGVLPAPDTPDLASTMTSAPGSEQAGVDQRRQRQQRRGRIAAGIGDEPRARDRAALALGQAVGDARRQRVRLRIPRARAPLRRAAGTRPTGR